MGDFGCDACFEGEPKAAWDHVSHGQGAWPKIAGDYAFEVRVTRCPTCAQAFLFIQNEGISWSDSPSTWYETALPVTAAEVAGFTDGGVSVLEAGALGAGRRRLESVENTGTHWEPALVTPYNREVTWATGEFTVQRDIWGHG
jgi:hypothetical protein